MSSSTQTTYYMELQPGDAVQDGDQFRDVDGQWKPYTFLANMGGKVGYGVTARRPIRTTHQTTYEEVPGTRTLQQAVDQPQRERIAYEELQPGDIIQEGDEFRNADGRWHAYDASLCGSRVHGAWNGRARRPYKISAILEIGDALANAQTAATQLQDERDKLRAEMDIVKGDRMNLREALAAEQRAHKVTMASGLQACSERDEACRERDLARSEVARLSTELWARKPLEDRVASLTEELAQARAELQRLQEVVGNLYNEPTARQVQQMLRTWATELDWSAGCFDSAAREQIDTIQKTLIAVIERIEGMLNPEGGSDGE